MPLPFASRAGREVVGLDLDGAYVAAVQASPGGVTRAVSEDLPPGLLRDGEVADVAGLGEALRSFFKRHRLPRRVRLGVANRQIAVRSLELPRIEDEHERTVAVRFQAQDAVPMPLEEAVLDYQVIEEADGGGGPRMRVVVVAARESMISAFVKAVRDAGLRPESIDLNAFALVRACSDPDGVPGPDGEVPGADARVHCHLGSVANLAVAVGSACLFTRPVNAARDDEGTLLTAAIAEEIRLSIDFYMTQPEARRVSDVVVSGPDAGREGLEEELTALIGLPVHVAEPPSDLGGVPIEPGDDIHRHTVATGLALGAAA